MLEAFLGGQPLMGYVASSLATVPRSGFAWYVFVIEMSWEDSIKKQLTDNFLQLGKRVGPDVLVVRGYDEAAMAKEVVEAVALADRRFETLEPPALIVTNRPLQSFSSPDGLQGAKIITFDLRGVNVDLPRLFEQLVDALRNSEAMDALEDSSKRGRVRVFWSWLAQYAELKPTFFGFGPNINAILEKLSGQPQRSWKMLFWKS